MKFPNSPVKVSPPRWSWAAVAAIAAAGSFGLELSDAAFVENLIQDGILGHIGTALAASAITLSLARKLLARDPHIFPHLNQEFDMRHDIRELKTCVEGIVNHFESQLEAQRQAAQRRESDLIFKHAEREVRLNKKWHEYVHATRDAAARIRERMEGRLKDFSVSSTSTVELFECFLQDTVVPEFDKLCEQIPGLFGEYTRPKDKVWIAIRFLIGEEFVTKIWQGNFICRRKSSSTSLPRTVGIAQYIPYNSRTKQNCVVKMDTQTNAHLKQVDANSIFDEDPSTLAAPINAVRTGCDKGMTKQMRAIFFLNSHEDLAFNQLHEEVVKCVVDPMSSIVSEVWQRCEEYFKLRFD